MKSYICKTCGNNFDSFWNIQKVPCPACSSRNTIPYQMPKAKTKEAAEPMLDDIDRQICYAMKRAIIRAIEEEPIFNISRVQLDDPGFTIVAMAEGSVPKSKLPVTVQISYGDAFRTAAKKDHQI